jgi:hypothetical protein
MKRTYLSLVLAIAALYVESAACTIVVLADQHGVLFANNEDSHIPNTRIWFVPPSDGRAGCAFVGYDDGWAQGGLSTRGLAFDWVATGPVVWERAAGMKEVTGSASAEMLATCGSVEDAIKFFQSHWEPGFAYARIMVADKSGASALISAADGKLEAYRSKSCAAFGFGGEQASKLISADSAATFENAATILRAARQSGEYATKYSNVFDLKSGAIQIVAGDQDVRLNLLEELARGPHFIDLNHQKSTK